MEKLTHKGVNGVFIPQKEWDRLCFLTHKKNNLLSKLLRGVRK